MVTLTSKLADRIVQALFFLTIKYNLQDGSYEGDPLLLALKIEDSCDKE